MKNIYEIEKLRTELGKLLSERGITQNELAQKIGISQGSISNFLTKKRGFSGEYALRIAKFIMESSTSTEPEEVGRVG